MKCHSNDSFDTNFDNSFEFDPKRSDCTTLKECLLKVIKGEFGVFLKDGEDLARVDFLLLLEFVLGKFEIGWWLVRGTSVALKVKDHSVLTSADAAEHELEVFV